MNGKRFIGRLQHGIADTGVAAEYHALAEGDELAARLLQERGLYRQSAYFAVQAMEKYARARIFRFISARHACYRERTATHNLDELLSFLLEIICRDEATRSHVTVLLNERVMGGLRFGKLHNDLRYPSYSERHGAHSVLKVDAADSEYALLLLTRLKEFLDEIERLAR